MSAITWLPKNLLWALGAIGVFALVAVVGTLLATQVIASSNGSIVIEACVNQSEGEPTIVRIVGNPSECEPEVESPLSWNQEGPQGPAGPKGDTGAAGAAGPKGNTGDKGVSGYQRVGVNASCNNGFLQLDKFCGKTVSCPAGKVVLGGGHQGTDDITYVHASYPSSNTAWTVNVRVHIGGDSYAVWAVCAFP